MQYHEQSAWLGSLDPHMLGIEAGALKTAAATPAVILIRGDCGTGKTALARLLHQNSPRAKRLFVPIHCVANPDFLSEAGSESGDIGFDLVDRVRGGTLFIKEIGALSALGQGRLLRLVDSSEIRSAGDSKPRRIDMRLIASTSGDLEAMGEAGKFLPELFHRVNVVRLDLPTLNARLAQLPDIAKRLLEDIAKIHKRQPPEIEVQALTELENYHWPGNIRQLRSVLERAVVFTPEGEAIRSQNLALPRRGASKAAKIAAAAPQNKDFHALSLEEYFQSFVIEHQGSMSESDLAKKLGISRKSLWERRRRLNIPRVDKANKEH